MRVPERVSVRHARNALKEAASDFAAHQPVGGSGSLDDYEPGTLKHRLKLEIVDPGEAEGPQVVTQETIFCNLLPVDVEPGASSIFKEGNPKGRDQHPVRETFMSRLDTAIDALGGPIRNVEVVEGQHSVVD
jgi:hypothetical protein